MFFFLLFIYRRTFSWFIFWYNFLLGTICKTALKAYDWYLLGVTIIVQINKADWKARLCAGDSTVVNHDLVINAARSVVHEALRGSLLSVFQRGHLPYEKKLP